MCASQEEPRKNSENTCAIPVANGRLTPPRLPPSPAHTCSPSISFIKGSPPAHLKPFSQLYRSPFVLSEYQIDCMLASPMYTHTHTQRDAHTVSFSLGQWGSLVDGPDWLDKGTDLISSLGLLTQSSSVITAAAHADHQSLSIPSGAGVSRVF